MGVGATVVADFQPPVPIEAPARGEARPVAVIIGNCAEEGRLFTRILKLLPVTEPLIDRMLHAAFFSAFASDVDDGCAVVAGADVPDVGLSEFVCADAGQECGEDECEIAFCPVGLALRFLVFHDGFEQCRNCGAGEALGRA